MNSKKVWKKTGFGILFVAACFIAMYILTEFHGDLLMVGIAAVLLMIAAFLFLHEVFSDKIKNWVQLEEETEEIKSVKEMLPNSGDGEFRLKISKHMKEMESTQKELIEVLKNQNTLIQAQLENLEHEIYMLSEKQINQTKSVIKFNKENARQMAISERETLEYVMMEIKKAIEDNAGVTEVRSVAQGSTKAPETVFAASEEPVMQPDVMVDMAALEEVAESELFEVSDLPDDEEFVMPDLPALEDIPDVVEEEPDIPEISDDLDLSALFEDMAEAATENFAEEMLIAEEIAEEAVPIAEEVAVETVPVVEEAVEEVPVPKELAEEAAPAVEPLAGLGGDPNAMMTPEDIAKLLASMGQ